MSPHTHLDMSTQLCIRDAARMNSKRQDPPRSQLLRERDSKQDVRRLRLSIRSPRIISLTTIEIIVIQTNLTKLMSGAAQIDDPSTITCSFEFRHEKASEQEMSDVVRCELRFDAFSCECVLGHSHDSGIVDQDVDFVDRVVDGCCCCSDGVKAGQVERDESRVG